MRCLLNSLFSILYSLFSILYSLFSLLDILHLMEEYVVRTDGGARGNPGPAASGAVVERRIGDRLKVIEEISEWLGEATNNVAEYQAVIFGLESVKRHAKKLPVLVDVVMDSQLITEQMNGNYRVRNEGLKPLYNEVRELCVALGGVVTFRHVPRAENKHADRLVNQAIDAALGIK